MKTRFAGTVLLAIALMLPALPLKAATAAGPDVHGTFEKATQASSQLRESADRLHAISRGGALSWESHSRYLNLVTEDVNRMGKMLTQLEGLAPHASDTQRAAIENLRPRLTGAANALTSAIALLESRSYNTRLAPYQDSVRAVSEHVDSLHQELAAVTDYESAKARLARLGSAPAQTDSAR